jgi:sodium pump decarboxylase gamma subunit
VKRDGTELNFTFDIQNIIDGQGISIAITGMVIVFFALSVISLFIAALPHILTLFARRWPESEGHQPTRTAAHTQEAVSDEAVAAIAMAFHHRRQA